MFPTKVGWLKKENAFTITHSIVVLLEMHGHYNWNDPPNHISTCPPDCMSALPTSLHNIYATQWSEIHYYLQSSLHCSIQRLCITPIQMCYHHYTLKHFSICFTFFLLLHVFPFTPHSSFYSTYSSKFQLLSLVYSMTRNTTNSQVSTYSKFTFSYSVSQVEVQFFLAMCS